MSSPGEALRPVCVDHQVGFSAFEEKVPTPPVPNLHFISSVQVLHRLLRDMDPPVGGYNNSVSDRNDDSERGRRGEFLLLSPGKTSGLHVVGQRDVV